MQENELKHFLEIIREKLKNPLPGEEAQKKMMPVSRLKMSLDIPINAKNGAVLLMLYLKAGEITICFIKRATDGGVHSGQIALPGGKKDDSDKNIIETALRETEEELGINPQNIQILGELSDLYIPVSNYIVFPVVGFHDQKPRFKINKSEVEELIEVPLYQLINSENCALSIISVNNLNLEVPCYIFGKYKIWGATAMILSEFIQILAQKKFMSKRNI